MAPNLACVTALGLALLLAGCTAIPFTPPSPAAKPESTAVKPESPAPEPVVAVNGTCPISGRPVDPKVPGVDYEGRTIGFCSPICTSRWRDTPIAIKDHFLRMSESKRRGMP